MQRFPLASKVYIWAMVGAGVPAFVYAYRLGIDESRGNLLLLLWSSSAVMTLWKVPLYRGAGGISSRISLGVVPTFFTLLYFGPLAGMIAGTLSCIVSSLYPRRSYCFQALFSIAALGLSVLASGLILRLVGLAPADLRTPAPRDLEHWRILCSQLPVILVATGVYCLINTGSVATAISLSTGKNPLRFWRERCLGVAPGYLAGASCATLSLALGLDHWLVVGSIAAPILFLTYHSYKIYMDKVQASERHIQELEKGKTELEHLAEAKRQHIGQLQDTQAQLTCAFEHEHRIAEALQGSFLLTVPDGTFPRLSVETRYRPASDEALVGGDFYDTFALPGGKVALVIGDASGKGLTAAIRTTEVKYALRAYAHEPSEIGAVLARLNEFVCAFQNPDRFPFGAFTVLALGVVDTNTGEVAISSAGTEPPLVLRATGEAIVIDTGGMPLGVEPGETYAVATLCLSPGDILLLATDGITEARHGKSLLKYSGFVRLAKEAMSLGSLPQMGQAILEGAQSFARGRLQDDVCLLLAQWK